MLAATKKICLIIPAQLLCTFLFGQEKYPPLTKVISFYELQKKAIERVVKWENPNGSLEEMKLIIMAIPIDEGMKEQTKEFVHTVYGFDSIWINPRMMVFHAMGDGDLKTSLEVSSFLNDRIPESWGNLFKAGSLPNGAHFIIDRDGTVICLSPPVRKTNSEVSFERNDHHWFVKRHQDGNPVAIGIENVTPKRDYTSITHAQLIANAQLARWLIWFENGKIEYVTSHHQFDDDKNYDQLLKAFYLQNLKKEFRTKGRADIGEKNLTEITKLIKAPGIPVKKFFE
jgi:hypothetical protein